MYIADEPDAAAGGASQDVRQRVKKKAERGMQQKKDSMFNCILYS